MTDIVERLKLAAEESCGHEWPELNEAAEEIEKLREALKNRWDWPLDDGIRFRIPK